MIRSAIGTAPSFPPLPLGTVTIRRVKSTSPIRRLSGSARRRPVYVKTSRRTVFRSRMAAV